MFKKALILIILLSFGFTVIANFQMIKYLFKQGYGQLNIIHSAINIDQIVKSSETTDSIVKQLLFIQKVKKYAEDSLNLEKTKNYTTFYNAGNNEINWLVLAAFPYELKAYYWKFPIIGKVPYLGFFSAQDAYNEAKKLKSEGFDVRIAHPTAWSTLKIFKDPILSTMLRYSKGKIAEIIIHETTHATFYFKNKANFNENFANFIGKKSALQFLKSNYGKNSNEYLEYKNELLQKTKQNLFLIKSAKKLDSLYTLISDSSEEQKIVIKRQTCQEIHDDYFIEFPNHKKSNTDSIFFNNSFYTQFLLYNTNYSKLENILEKKYKNSIKSLISDIKLKVEENIEIDKYLNLN